MIKYEESKENPLYKEFGIISNTFFVLRKCHQYCPVVIVISILGIICNSILLYYWGFVGKYAIDILNSNVGESEKIKNILFLFAGAAACAAILCLGSIYSNSKTSYKFNIIRMKIITERVDRALDMRYEFLEKPEVLDMHERASEATESYDKGVEGMMHIMEILATSLVTLIVTFASVAVIEWRLVIVLVLLAIIQYCYHKFCVRVDKKNVWDKLVRTWRQMDYMEHVTQDFDYAKDIRFFRLSDFLLSKEQKLFEKRWKLLDYHENLWFSHAEITNFLYLVEKACIYFCLFYAVLYKGLSIGNYTLYMALAIAFSKSLMDFLHRFGDYGRASLEVNDYRSFMELEFDGENEENLTLQITDNDYYTIEFHNVSFRYYGATRDTISNLNLTLHPGERLAVVGLNGAGKSTMIKLLLRLYQPTSGYITLNGVDIKRYDIKEYFKLFSPVFQNTELISFTIEEYIAMDIGDGINKEKAYKCAIEAGLGEKIDSLDKGMLTQLLKIIDSTGVDLSGGEKQKLALARALYKNAPIVVLDEPTAALDAIAEKSLYESFNTMIGNKSAIFISHRLSSTRFCDKIIMFRAGKIIEYGTHDELIQKQGEYAKLFEVQAQYYQEEHK